jgi:hypothetical protein
MSRHTKAGRNDLCACGSGKKFKNCCATKTTVSWTNRALMVLVAAAILGGVAAGVMSYGERTSGMPGQVWSPEHGHFHDAGTVE